MNSVEPNNSVDDAPIDKEKLLKKMALQMDACDNLAKVQVLMNSGRRGEAKALLDSIPDFDNYDLSPDAKPSKNV